MADSEKKPLNEAQARRSLAHYRKNYLYPIDEATDPRVWYGAGDGLFRIVLSGKTYHLSRNSALQFYIALRDCLLETASNILTENPDGLAGLVVPAPKASCIVCSKSLPVCSCSMESLHKKVLAAVGDGENVSVQQLQSISFMVMTFVNQHDLAVTASSAIAKFLQKYQDYVAGTCEKWEFLSALAELE